MLNSIYETSVKPDKENKQKIVYLIIRVIRYLLLGLSAIALTLAFYIDNGFWFVLLLLLGFFAFLTYIQSKFYNFYDYSIVQDQITISKIVNNLRNKKLISFCMKNILELGKIDGDNYLKYSSDKSIKKIDALNGVVYDNDYYVLIELDGVNYLVLLRFDRKMLSIMFKYNIVRLIEKDFKEILNNYE